MVNSSSEESEGEKLQGRDKRRRDSTIISAIITGIATVMAATIAASYSSRGQTSQQAVKPASPALSSPTPTTLLLSIRINPVDGPLSRCATFTGTGDVPRRRTLWLVVLTPGSWLYYPKSVTVNAVEHKWTASGVILGSKDDPANMFFKVYAVLVDNADDRLFQQSISTGVGLPNLPSDTDWSDPLQVSRNGDLAECKWNH
jgi:hypothetical protein